MSAEARILDANANRAREALRVMEDVARFALDDPRLTAELKTLRHDLRAALAALPEGWLEANRDTAGDVGTTISGSGETERAGLADVATAAGKRLGEALRVIEETAKTVSPPMAQQVEAIRYRVYAVESGLLGRLGTGLARQWRVCVVLTESLCSRPWEDVVRAAIDGGADCIQIREKNMGGADLATRTEQVVAMARPAGVSVIVNDRPDIALARGADGVHLGPDDVTVADTRRLAGRGLIVGVSTRHIDEASAAVNAGADYCGVGTMYATGTKPGVEPTGPGYLQAFVERFPEMPHLAIGGITPDNIARLVAAGARGVAVSSAVCSAAHPDRVVASLREALHGQTSLPMPPAML